MEILDKEDQVIDTKAKNLAIASLLGYLVVGITALVGLYGSWMSLSAFSSTGAPDAVELSKGIGISNYAQWVMTLPLIIGVVCQNVSSSNTPFHKPQYWRFMMIISILSLIASFIPLSFILLIVAMISVIIVSKNKSQYFSNEE